MIDLENKIMQLLEQENKYDKHHLLVLFKMYNFKKGIIKLCDTLNLREELLNFYIQNNDAEEIINLCKAHGEA
jgi:hypothetical protein